MAKLKNIKKNKYVLGLALILAVSLAIKIALVPEITTGHVQDDYWMITLGKNLFNNHAYELTRGHPYDNTQPVYPFLLGLSINLLSPFLSNYNHIGAILAIIISSALIIMTYVFWKKIENEKVALIASFFMAFSWFSIVQSLRMSASTLFALSLVTSLFFTYKAIEKNKYLPVAALFALISALVRWEGYALVGVLFISFISPRKKEIFKGGEINYDLFKKDYFILAVLIVLIPLFFWSLRSHNCCGSWIPSYGYQKQLSTPGKTWQGGLNYFKHLPEYIPWYLLMLIAGGLYFGIKKRKRHYPILLSIAFILFIHLKFRGRAGHSYLMSPLLYGYASIFLLEIKKFIDNKLKNA